MFSLLNRSGLRLVVLNACDTGKLVLEPFRSIAPALINAQVPAVVAQQFQIPGETTRAFVGDFYRSLAAGMPIDACVTEGRKAIMDSSGLGQPEWDIPVLYTRMARGRLFSLPQVTTVPSAAQQAHAATTAPTVVPATLPAIADLAGVEQAVIGEPIIVQLTRKRRELVLHRLRGGMYERPQAHLMHREQQLGAEIRALTDQLKTGEA